MDDAGMSFEPWESANGEDCSFDFLFSDYLRDRPTDTGLAAGGVGFEEPASWEHMGLAGSNVPVNDDDARSSCSSCSAVCPSECGESGHETVCCHDEDCDTHNDIELCLDDDCQGASDACSQKGCEAQAPQDLCASGHCQGVANPCTETACRAGASQDACASAACRKASRPCTNPECFQECVASCGSGNVMEAAAAAALTSFGHQSDPSPINTFTNGAQMVNLCSNGFSFASCQTLPERDPIGMGYVGMQSACNTTSGGFSQQIQGQQQEAPVCQWEQFAGLELFSHLRDHHIYSHDHSEHMRPCLADNPTLAGAKCPLPNSGFDQLDTSDQHPFPQCGFAAQDPIIFADHVVNEHRDLLSQLPGTVFNNTLAGWGEMLQREGGYLQLGNFQESPSTTHPAYAAKMSGYQEPSLKTTGEGHGKIMNSGSPIPNLLVGAPSLPTPETPLSPKSFEALGNQALQLQEPTPEYSTPSQAYGPHNAYRCYWTDPKTGVTCLQDHKNSDELDAHCRDVHTKPISKTNGGFRCMWQSCKRMDVTFQTKAKLNRHLQTHTGFKPLACHICGMRLSAKQALDQHIRTHTNEHPYKCSFEGCDKTFKQHSALTMHIRTHTKEKPLKCEECGAVFTESSNLSKHRRTHAKIGNFNCEICQKDFHRLDQLRRHLKSSHKDYEPEAIDGAIERARHWKKKADQIRRAAMDSVSPISTKPPMNMMAEAGSVA